MVTNLLILEKDSDLDKSIKSFNKIRNKVSPEHHGYKLAAEKLSSNFSDKVNALFIDKNMQKQIKRLQKRISQLTGMKVGLDEYKLTSTELSQEQINLIQDELAEEQMFNKLDKNNFPVI